MKTAARRPTAPGFTLIELMVSIALVLIIILGVNAIFKMASDAVGTGTALGAADRANRAAQTVFVNDIRTGAFVDGPMLLIRSERVGAFRNRADELADRDNNVMTQDFNNDNNETGAGELTLPLIYNNRNHRIDRMGFFSSDMYRRQTGTESAGSSRFVDDGSAMEAYIWYGHLDQPNGKALATPGRFEHKSPGERPTTASPNPNNYYATDWILGRSVILLREDPVLPGMTDPPNYFDYKPPAGDQNRFSPLDPNTQAKDPDRQGVKDWLGTSRYDLAQTSINRFRQTLSFDIALNRIDIDGPKPTWYERLGGEWGGAGNARFQGYTYPTKPLNAYGLARTMPVFVPGCTQFVVEYAGDYLSQDVSTGNIVGTYLNGPGSTDGQIDYVLKVQPAAGGLPSQRVRRTRWYGMPRNTDVSNDRVGPIIPGGLAATADHHLLSDVVPLRDALISAGKSETELEAANFFEHFEGLPPQNNYATTAIQADPRRVRYYAAWGPGDLAGNSQTRPKMLRITMTVDEPNGRMAEGQTYEYIIDLP